MTRLDWDALTADDLGAMSVEQLAAMRIAASGKAPSTPHPHPCPQCCAGLEQECPCSLTSGPNPGCLKVEWEGLEHRSPYSGVNCAWCDCFESYPTFVPCHDVCTWKTSRLEFYATFCANGGISAGHFLSIEITGEGPYTVTVRHGEPNRGFARYERTYDEKPDMSTWDQEEIPYVATEPNMLSSCRFTADAKVKLTSLYEHHACLPFDEVYPRKECGQCTCEGRHNEATQAYKATISGFTGSNAFINGEYWLDLDDGNGNDIACSWKYSAPPLVDVSFTVSGNVAAGTRYIAGVGSSWWTWSTEIVGPPPDCAAMHVTFDGDDFWQPPLFEDVVIVIEPV